ncbi:MAG: molecular chaperone DnaJ [Chloroflexi bacterium]|nr:molecular chaperone DnaJ [Chloroflexota bacterium]
MKSDLIRTKTPEEAELERKKLELAAIENELAERELDLSTLEAELRAFERRYLRTVGARYAELDELEAQIAEAQARLHPKDTQAQQYAQQTRTQARESAQAAGTAQASKQKDEFKPPEDLKKLYRELAKKIHPDLATDEKERARRNQMMAEVNRAYQDGNGERLQQIWRDWEFSPESVTGEGIAAELVRIIRKVAQVRDRLNAIETKIVQLHDADLYKLMMKVREAQQEGRDLLAEMVARLEEQIVGARERFAELDAQRRGV